MEFTFSKWNGLGNDFVIVDGAREKIKEDQYAETAVKVCDRHFGVGADVTLACGTGASATLVAAVLNGRTERKADIKLDGGILTMEWKDDHHIYMSGPAEEVFRGVYVKE